MGRCYEYIKGAHCRDDIASLTNKEILQIVKFQKNVPTGSVQLVCLLYELVDVKLYVLYKNIQFDTYELVSMKMYFLA